MTNPTSYRANSDCVTITSALNKLEGVTNVSCTQGNDTTPILFDLDCGDMRSLCAIFECFEDVDSFFRIIAISDMEDTISVQVICRVGIDYGALSHKFEKLITSDISTMPVGA